MINLILQFMIFAIIGYIVEVTYVYLGDKQWINRGFLHGPYIPIYALGSILIINFLMKYYDDIIIVFFMGMIICSALEYYASYIMEKIFHRRWWDYSKHKYNLNGRIALKNSVLFGIGSLIIIYFLNPLINLIISKISTTTSLIIAILFLIIFILDLIFSSIEAFKTNNNIVYINKFDKLFNKNQILSNIRTRILKAYPHLLKNNDELLAKIQKLKKDLKKKKIKNK